MSQFNFEYSIQFELFRISYTFQRLDFYIENNYFYDLPKNVTKEMTAAEVLSTLANEYDEGSYKEEVLLLEKEVIEKAEIINQMRLDSIIKSDIEYNIFLTKYGVGGSFGPPNFITLKITDRKTSEQKFATILHEMIHLHVHDWVMENNLTHWQKERVVDFIGLKYFP